MKIEKEGKCIGGKEWNGKHAMWISHRPEEPICSQVSPSKTRQIRQSKRSEGKEN